MEMRQFVAKILATPCEKCPIKIYCEMCVAFSCHSTARKYYLSHGGACNGEQTKSRAVFSGQSAGVVLPGGPEKRRFVTGRKEKSLQLFEKDSK